MPTPLEKARDWLQRQIAASARTLSLTPAEADALLAATDPIPMPTREELEKTRHRTQTALDLCAYKDADAPVTVRVGDAEILLAATDPIPPEELAEAVKESAKVADAIARAKISCGCYTIPVIPEQAIAIRKVIQAVRQQQAEEPIPPGELAEAVARLSMLAGWWESRVATVEREDAAAIRTLIQAVRQQAEQPEVDLYSEAVKARIREACWVSVQAYIQSDLTRLAATGEAVAAGLRSWETSGTMAAFLPEQPKADQCWAEAIARLESADARSDMDIDDIRMVCGALRRQHAEESAADPEWDALMEAAGVLLRDGKLPEPDPGGEVVVPINPIRETTLRCQRQAEADPELVESFREASASGLKTMLRVNEVESEVHGRQMAFHERNLAAIRQVLAEREKESAP